MADKVYGICSRNKCRREAIEKVAVTKLTNQVQYHSSDNLYVMGVFIPYPEGCNHGNCMPLNIRASLTLPSGKIEYHDVPYELADGTLTVKINATYNANTPSGFTVELVTTAPAYTEMVVTALLATYDIKL